MERFQWRRTTIVVGPALLDHVAEVWNECLPCPRQIVILCGRASAHRHGFLPRLQRSLSALAPVATYEGIGACPTPATVDQVADYLRARSPDAVVALGGGSVIDTAKAANSIAGTGYRSHDVLSGGHVSGVRLASSLVAIPTTAGTGSEVTPFATVWDFDRARKLSLDAPSNLPHLAILDPSVTATMDIALTRQTAADALGHGLEALWARRRSVLSDTLACAALELIVPALTAVLGAPGSLLDRAELQKGALLAGMAISMTRTAAAHAISYGLTIRYGIPHGFAVAELLPGVLRLNESALSPAIRTRLEAIFRAEGEGLVAAVAGYLEEHQLILGLARYDVPLTAVSWLVEHSHIPGRLDNNIRSLSDLEVETLVEEAISRVVRA